MADKRPARTSTADSSRPEGAAACSMDAASPQDAAPTPLGSARRAERADEQEHFGPLLLARYVKDDGRGLILYAHATEERA